jgi:hypothetical protein
LADWRTENFLEEFLALLHTEPAPTEIIVERAKVGALCGDHRRLRPGATTVVGIPVEAA